MKRLWSKGCSSMSSLFDNADGGGLDEWQDFSNASPWEEFVSDIERALTDWGLRERSTLDAERVLRKGRKRGLSFGGEAYVLEVYLCGDGWTERPDAGRALQWRENEKHLSPALLAMSDASRDFPALGHRIERWFGLHEFVVLSPCNGGAGQASCSESYLLLSSLGTALHNCSTGLPGFVPRFDAGRGAYEGVCVPGLAYGGSTLQLQVDVMPHVPDRCRTLESLTRLFAAKVGYKDRQQAAKITIAVQQTYAPERVREEG